MQLAILLLIALVVGYLIARSRWSKAIDDTASDAAKSTQSFFEGVGNRIRGKPKETVSQGEIVENKEEPGN